jgi:hypothetical protein
MKNIAPNVKEIIYYHVKPMYIVLGGLVVSMLVIGRVETRPRAMDF